MNQSKTIKLFLMDGEATGRIKCSLANWTGIAYKIPRTELKKCNDIEYLNQSGVYFLFSTDENYNQIVYIGQAGIRKNGQGLLLRVQESHPNIEWTEVVMFTRTDNSLGPTEISYLEHKFYNMALQAERYKVTNGNDPNPGNITEETESELEEFIDYAKIVMGVLGHKLFEPINSPKNEEFFHMKYNNCIAKGKRTSDGFLILKGSQIVPETTNSCKVGIQALREKYKDKINDKCELTSDILLSSPSAAASFIGGTNLNGKELWHDSKERSLNDLERKE